MLLCYCIWLKQDNFWALDDEETLQAAKTAIAMLLKSVERLMPHEDGQGWHLPKMHEQLHIPNNIVLFGVHKNVCTGPQEHNHIENSKKPAKQTQKCKFTFDWQLANHLAECYLIDFVQTRICDTSSSQSGACFHAPTMRTTMLQVQCLLHHASMFLHFKLITNLTPSWSAMKMRPEPHRHLRSCHCMLCAWFHFYWNKWNSIRKFSVFASLSTPLMALSSSVIQITGEMVHGLTM